MTRTLYRSMVAATILAGAGVPAAMAGIFHDYENFDEGFLGETVVHEGITYRDANRVSGFFPDGMPFDENELGSEYIVERATVFFDEFPEFGSRDNVLTFGRAFVPGDNLTIGPLASIWMDLDAPGDQVSLDLGYLENGPWGGIEFILEAWHDGAVVGTDSFFINDGGGRDNGAVATMSIDGVVFDQLHLYGWLNDAYTAPRGMIDDLTIRAIPGPGVLAWLGAAGLAGGRRRRSVVTV